MEQSVDCTEVAKEFMELTNENCDYVLGIARALAFAQQTLSKSVPENEHRQQGEE